MYNFERSPKRCVMQMGGWILLYMAPSPYIEPSFYHLQIELSPHMFCSWGAGYRYLYLGTCVLLHPTSERQYGAVVEKSSSHRHKSMTPLTPAPLFPP